MSIKKDSLEILLTRCLLVVIELCTQVVLARALGAEARGIFAICWTFLNVLLMIGVFGVGDANTYILASSKSTVSQVFAASIYIGTLASLMVGFGAYMIIHLPIAFFSKASRTEFLWAIIAVFPFILSLYFLAILRGLLSIKTMNVSRLLSSVVVLVGTYIFCFNFRLGVKGALIGRIVGAFFVVIFVVVRLWPKLVFKELFEGFRQVPRILHYAFRACFGFFAQRMSIQVGVLVMACFLARAEVGFYAIAIAMVIRIMIVPNSLRVILMPKLVQRNFVSSVLICQALRIMIPIVAVLSIMLGLICNPLIKYGFGKEFTPALTAIYILLIGTVFKSVSELVTTYLLATNRPGVSSSVRVLGVFINIILLLVFVRSYGLIGGCVATVLSYMAEALIMLLIFVRMSDIKSWRLLVLQKDDISYLWASVCSLAARFKQQGE